MSEERTEKPTARRKKESRKEGQVPRTPELGAWSGLLLLGLALPPLLGRELGRLSDLLGSSLATLEDPTLPDAVRLLREGATHVLFTLLLLGSAMMLVGVAGALAQGGFFLATKSVRPRWSKLDPVKGAKRVFGLQALWEGAKMLVKSAVVGLVVYLAIRSMMPLVGGLVPIGVVLDVVAAETLGMLRTVAVAGLFMAGADYAFQRRRIGKQTRMTKHEVKQEAKQTEGDPLLKSAIRSRQLAVSRNRMIADVATADVVLVNPTHIAIALRYEPEKGAPVVVARGAGTIAERIRAKAGEGDVPLVRDVPLARALYASTQVGQQIPAELFAAVAQVLAFVISRRSQGRTGGEHRSPRKESELPAVPAAGRRRRTGPPALGPAPIASGPAPTGR